MDKEYDRKQSSRSWFAVLNISSLYNNDDIAKSEKQIEIANQIRKMFEGLSPEEIVDKAIDIWCTNKPYRTCAVNYEIGDTGNEHLHLVLEDPSKCRFSAIQKLYPGIHLEKTRGSKEQAEDYILKRGQFAEKDHTVVVPARFKGQIKANRGSRTDLIIIEELIEKGITPSEIMNISIEYRKYERIIKSAFFAYHIKNVPVKREVKVYWHTGESGSGKSYEYVKLSEEHGEGNIYFMSDYETGGLDLYCGERILFMDEFKGNMSFQKLLNYTEGYKIQIHCRYANAYAIWSEVHITSIYPPEEVYTFMVDIENRNRDRLQQLLRRITKVIYHYKIDGEYKKYEMSTNDYVDYVDLKNKALGNETGFRQISMVDREIPFNN